MVDVVATIVLNPRFNRYNSHSLVTKQDGASREREAICDITFDGTGTYGAGGILVDFSRIRNFTKIISCEVLHTSLGVVATYVPGTADASALGKLKLFGSDPAAAGGAVTVLPEIADTSVSVRNGTFRVRITGN